MYMNYVHIQTYTTVSFHGLTFLLAVLSLADAAAMGGVWWMGLWVKVCLSGPVEKNRKNTICCISIHNFSTELQNQSQVHILLSNWWDLDVDIILYTSECLETIYRKP